MLPLRLLRVANEPPVVPRRFFQIVVADVVVGVEELLGQRRREYVAGSRHVVVVAAAAIDLLLAILHGEERAGRHAVLRYVAVVVVDGAPLAIVSARAVVRLTFV